MQKLPREYSFDGKRWYYKNMPIVAGSTCPIHGSFPSVYRKPDGSLASIDEKRCPYCHAKERTERELKRSMIPPRFQNKNLESYETPNTWQVKAKTTIQNYINNLDENLEKGRNIILIGGVGTGKTHLSIGLLKAVIENGGIGMFITASDLFMNIRDTWTRSSEITTLDRVQQFVDLDLLVIDEIGVQRGTDNEREILFSIINSRYNNLKPTVLLSNLSLKEVRAYIGERTFDRLKEDGGQIVVLNGESYRK